MNTIKENNNLLFLSGNMLKLIAAISMLIDHIGVMFFPDCQILRIIGRLAFPIFAFMIAEGCHFTKNKFKYFMSVFGLGMFCQLIYYFFDGSLDLGILMTFSFSIILIFILDNVKKNIFNENRSTICLMIYICAFVICTVAFWFLSENVPVDYGFWGIISPVLACLFRFDKYDNIPVFLSKIDTKTTHILMFSIGLAFLTAVLSGVQYYSYLAVILLLMYNGKRGKYRMKMFFYIFYPVHFAVLQIVSYLFS